MALLQDILYGVNIRSRTGKPVESITDLQIDSRKVSEGSCFIAIKGSITNGHEFIESAIAKGANVIVCEEEPVDIKNALFIKVENCGIAAGIMSHNFYGQPSNKIKLIGVTGTNGKTTVATLLFKLYSALGNKCGLISTVQNQVADEILPSTHTTPDAISVNELLSKMAEASCRHVFMEVSSHALDQNRVAGLQFSGGIFTNITHDHLDYHKTFDEYIKAKKKFFDELSSSAFAISNADDKRGSVMLQNTKAKK